MGALNNILPLIKWILFNTVCLRNPSRFLSLRTMCIRAVSKFGIYERQQIKMLDKFVSPGSTAIDIGANCGVYTFKLSQLVGEKGRVLAFEPSASIFSALKQNASGSTNIFCHQIGLSSEAKEGVTLWIPLLFGKIPDPALAGIDAPSIAYASFMNRWAFGLFHSQPTAMPVKKEIIATQPLDAFIDQINNLSFIKIDVEGHEVEVLKGATQILAQKRPVVQFESFFLSEKEKADWFLKFALGLNYDIYILSKEDAFELFTSESLIRSSSRNYYLVPKELATLCV